jgi:6-phosphogluconolactonase
MGMGEDGHTASLFPGVENPGENLESVIQVNARYQNRPASRITLTPMVFNSSRNLLFLVTGEEKAAVLQKVFSSQKDYLNLPIQRIEPKQGNLIWHVDASAAKHVYKP